MKRTPLRRVSKKRGKQRRAYTDIRKEYLRENPWCQVCVKEHRQFNQSFNQVEIYEGPIKSETDAIRRSNQIHHVRKCYGELLNDTRWFLAVCTTCHRYIEEHLSWARDEKRLYVQNQIKLIPNENGYTPQ